VAWGRNMHWGAWIKTAFFVRSSVGAFTKVSKLLRAFCLCLSTTVSVNDMVAPLRPVHAPRPDHGKRQHRKHVKLDGCKRERFRRGQGGSPCLVRIDNSRSKHSGQGWKLWGTPATVLNSRRYAGGASIHPCSARTLAASRIWPRLNRRFLRSHA